MKITLFLLLYCSLAVSEEIPNTSSSTATEVEKTADKKIEKKSEVGPHQGFVKSAGPYEIELISLKDGSFKIYLLDSELKNPIVKNSNVGVFIKSGSVESELTCTEKEDFFECKQSGKIFRKGELSVSSKRDTVRTEEVKINWPFHQETKDVKKK